MKSNNIKRLVCLILTCIMICGSCICVSAESISPNYECEETEISARRSRIDNLYDERTQALLTGDTEKVEQITNELKAHGVVQMTYSEMCDLIDVPMPRYEIEYDNYIYERFSDDFKWDDTVYTVMVINITPKNTDCNLCVRGSFTEKEINPMIAGAQSLLEVASFATGKVKILGEVVSMLDLLQSIGSNFDSTTVIEDVEAVYAWSFAESCSFHYIPSTIGTSGYSLIGRYNKVNGVISTSILSMDYDSSNGEALGTIDTYNYSVNIQAEDFHDEIDTVLNFYNGSLSETNYTEYIDIRGVDGEVVHRVNFLNPLYPNQVR